MQVILNPLIFQKKKNIEVLCFNEINNIQLKRLDR